jgi:hypothetical protein
MEMLQNVSQVVWVWVQTDVGDVKAIFSRHNNTFDLLWIFIPFLQHKMSSDWNVVVALEFLHTKSHSNEYYMKSVRFIVLPCSIGNIHTIHYKNSSVGDGPDQ